MSKLETYGLTHQDLIFARNKIAKQKDYLESQKFVTGNDNEKEKTLLDVSYSANLSTRYYPRILNKVDTFVSYSLSRGLVPLFLTVTLDGFFRRFMKGDYSEWTDKKRRKYKKHIPNNDTNGYYLDYLDNHNALTPKDLYKILGYQIKRFYKSDALRNIRKDGLDYTSIRVTEPHKDGVPHFHILMYVPKQFISKVYRAFQLAFPAPRNHVRLTSKNSTGTNQRDGDYICTIKDQHFYETYGFQTNIRSAKAYVLKYILKSFTNLINGKELDYLQAWYVHNKIPRIITTHTLVSQDVYHHASLLDADWYYLTDIKRNHFYTRDKVMNSFYFISEHNRELIFDNGHYKLINNGKVVKEFGQNNFFKMTFTVNRPFNPLPCELPFIHCSFSYFNLKGWRLVPKKKTYIYKIQNRDDYVDVFIDDELSASSVFDFNTGEIVNKRDLKSITKLSDQVLFDWYVNFDFDKYLLVKYPIIRNELIDRCILNNYKVSPNEYNTNFDVNVHTNDKVIIKQLKPRDMKDEWLHAEYECLKSQDIFFSTLAMQRYSQLYFEIEKRKDFYEK